MAVLAVPRQNANGLVIFFVNVAAIFAIFYFLLIRPQRKEQERHKRMIAQLKKGDEIVTAGGIIGTVIHAQEDRHEALLKAESVIGKLESMKLSKAATTVREGIEETLSYYYFPREHWRRIRTNNMLERLMREIR